jgi:hypothetical protein
VLTELGNELIGFSSLLDLKIVSKYKPTFGELSALVKSLIVSLAGTQDPKQLYGFFAGPSGSIARY